MDSTVPEDSVINSTNNVPYISADRSELAPLYSSSQEAKGLRAITTFFTVFSIAVAIILALQLHYGNYQVVAHGSVVTDSYDCSLISAEIIKVGGNAVDAAVAATLCMGVVRPHLTGLGGGGLMLIYDQRQRKLKDCIDFRVSKSRGSSIGVPGFLAGLFTAHDNHGVLPWKQIVVPSISLARKGFLVTDSLLSSRSSLKDNTSILYSWLSPLTNGQITITAGLADTLESIANNGPDVFYKGNLTDQLVQSGELLASDLANYRAMRGLANGICVEHYINGFKIVVPSRGSGGHLLINTMDHLNHTSSMLSSSSLTHSVTPIADVGEAILDNRELYWPLHSGSVVVTTDRNDLYVSVVSGLGSVLGSQQLLPAGFILNNGIELGTYSGDGDGYRATSLAVPVIAVSADRVCGDRFITGAADARDMVQVLYRLLILSMPSQTPVSSASGDNQNNNFNNNNNTLDSTLFSVIEEPRVRFTATNSGKHLNIALVEDNSRNSSKIMPHYPSEEELIKLGNEGFVFDSAPVPYPSINIIGKTGDLIVAHADSRGEGVVLTF